MKINNPCPVYFSNSKIESGNMHCKSCNKTVIDFTGKSIKEIKAVIKPNTCGLFDIEQLTEQKQFKLSGLFKFYTVMFISIFGFKVSPLSAQSLKKDSIANDGNIKLKKESKKDDSSKKYKSKIKKRRRSIFFRRHLYRPLGGINF